MAGAENPETLEDVRLWIAAHDGKINAYWKAQHEWNEKTEQELDGHARRIGALERRVAAFAAAAAAVGAAGGSLLSGAF